MSIANNEKIDIISQDFLVYISHLQEAYNNIEESEEKTIIQVNNKCIQFIII